MRIKITILCYFLNDAGFFGELAQWFGNKGFNVDILVLHYRSFLYLKKKGLNVYMLDSFVRPKEVKNAKPAGELLSRLLEFDKAAKRITLNKVRNQYERAFCGIRHYFNHMQSDICFVWNGYFSIPSMFVKIAKRLGKKVYFFELSNIKGRFLMDSDGLNIDSSLMHENIDAYHADYSRIKKFVCWYTADKERSHCPPQSRWKVDFQGCVLDWFHNLCNVNRCVYEIRNAPFVEVINEVRRRRPGIHYDGYDFRKRKNGFIFFPMQVKGDIQMILFSRLSQEEALRKAVSIAGDAGVDLLVKPHPAEKDARVWDTLASVRRNNNNVSIVNENTFLLIKYSRAVITVNSTVGIEALMYYKPVIVLGDAFYRNLTVDNIQESPSIEKIEKFLDYYIFEYLIEGDYYNPDKNINIDRVIKIIRSN